MAAFLNFFHLSLLSLVRDRLLHVIAGLSALIFFSIPAFSMFSMRQVQELSVSMSLSAISFILLLITLLAGATSIWRDIEKRYTSTVLGLPVSRSAFVMGKFCAIAAVIILAALVMMIFAWLSITISAGRYPSGVPVNWLYFVAAVSADVLKYILLLSLAFLFSTVSTSFFFPFFVTIALYFSGSASQEVFEFINGQTSHAMPVAAKAVVKGLYYILPNFGAFDFKVHAIYSLQISSRILLMMVMYFICYTGIALYLTAWSFSKREIL